MWAHIVVLIGALKSRWETINKDPEAGYASEAVLVTALLIIAAIAVITIIVAKVTSKANDIDLGLMALSVVR
jgi:hypothetical protein